MSEVFLYEGYATGAIFRPPDSRDYELAALPEVQSRIAAGLPQSYMVTPMDGVPATVKLNQGSVPQCVASSLCIAKSVQDFKDIRLWQAYDDDEVYRACGGTGSTGIPTDKALRYAQAQGCLVQGTSRRYKIASYLFAPQKPGEFRQTLGAALMEQGPCLVAMILPVNFGWNSGEGLQGAQSYHQMCLMGWEGMNDPDYAVFLNSWGVGFGNQGFVRIKWASMEGGNFQGSYCYAYKLVDFLDEQTRPPEPEPKPPEPKPPEPQPGPVVVSGYVTASSVPVVRPGDPFRVTGQFPTSGIVQASWGAHNLPTSERSATSVSLQAPDAEGVNPVVVRVEGNRGQGPPLAVQRGQTGPKPDPDPDPEPAPGPFTVEVKAWILPRSRTKVGIAAYSKDSNGAMVAGTATATLAGRDLGARAGGGVYSWQTVGTPGEVAEVTVVDGSGRSAKGSAVVGAPGVIPFLSL